MIVSCPECNGKVSTTAEKCPHCGHRINPPKSAPASQPQVNVDVKQTSPGCMGGISQGMGIGCGCLLFVIALVFFFLFFAGAGHHR